MVTHQSHRIYHYSIHQVSTDIHTLCHVADMWPQDHKDWINKDLEYEDGVKKILAAWTACSVSTDNSEQVKPG